MTMTPQQIFDHVAAHLLKQGKQALDDYGNCCYRGEGGTMCAVGCLIPDALYDERIEGQNMLDLRIVGALIKANVLPIDDLAAYECSGMTPNEKDVSVQWRLLSSLQDTHDHGNDDWPGSLRHLARKYELAIPAILQEALA